jgi:Fur family peroxide stress response transcriptional regulator
MKHSTQKDLVSNNILHRYDHPTAEAVLSSVREISPKISLATVYRHLDRLVKEGLVNRIIVPGGPDHFDPVRHEHIHAYCTECGELFDVNLPIADRLAAKIKSDTGLEVDHVHFIASGLCKKCKI